MLNQPGGFQNQVEVINQADFNAKIAASINNIAAQMDAIQSRSGISNQLLYPQLYPYDRKYDLRDTTGGGLDAKSRSLGSRHNRDKGVDVEELSKGAKEVTEERRKIYQERKGIIDKAIESGTLSSRELVDALEQLTALQKGLVETDEEAKALSAEVKYRKEYAEMIGANFEDKFLVRTVQVKLDSSGKLDKDNGIPTDVELNEAILKKYIESEEEWSGAIDQLESSRRIKQFITENSDKFGKDEVLKAIESSAWDFAKRYREMKPVTPYGIEEQLKEEGFTDKKSPEYAKRKKELKGAANHALKDWNERIVLGAIVEAGIPYELRSGTGSAKEKDESIGLKDERDDIQRKLWTKEVWRDGTPWEVGRFSRLLDWEDFMKYAIQEKFAKPELQEKAKKMGIKWLNKYWNMADRKGGFDFYWHDRNNPDKSRQNIGEKIHVGSQEDMLKLISDSELPAEIKQEFRDKYSKAIEKRDIFVEEFVNSPEYKFWFETTDHGISIDDVWKNNIEPELDKYLNMGLINQKTKDKVEETYRWMAERGTKTEERGQNYHMLVVKTVRNMMDEERRKLDLYNEELDFSNALNTEAIYARLSKVTSGTYDAQTKKWDTDGPKGEPDHYPPRSELGGADRQRLIERIVKSEIEREQQVRRLKNELERIDVNKPNKWDLFTAQWDQGIRIVGNVLKTFVFGHTPLEAMHAIRQNRDNIDLLKLNYRDQLTTIDQRKRELQQEITNLQNEFSFEQAAEQTTWHKEIAKKGYMSLKENLENERRTTFKGLSTQPDRRKLEPSLVAAATPT